ncbi:MAG: hypothetical protein AAGF92_20345 [Myxococcota bacterium]
MSSKLAFVLGAVLVVWGWQPSEAAAWTRAIVESADATVEVDRNASASVLLNLEVEVHAGWLRELEVAGLGDDVELDRRHPPYFRSDEGEVYRPEATLTDDGRIRLAFERREAPRRGEYRVLIRYRSRAETRAVGRTGQTEVSWSLPAWETGLHDVSVDIRAPRGSHVPVELRDNSPGIELTSHERPRVSQLVWRRIHLPRHTPWKLSFYAPKGALAVPTSGPKRESPNGFQPLLPTEPRSVPWAIMLFALLVLAKRRAIQVTLGKTALLLNAPWPLVLAGTALFVLAVTLAAPEPSVAAVALLLMIAHRSSRESNIPHARGWEARTPMIEAVRETPLSDLVDGTLGSGWVVATGATVAMLALGEPVLAIATLPLYLTATRHHRCPSHKECARVLARFVSSLKIDHDAPPMCFRWETHEKNAPRCRVILPKERAGLLGLSLITTSRSIGCVARREVMLLVETRAQSDADDLVRRATGAEPDFRTDDGRIGRVVEWGRGTAALIRSLECRTQLRPLRKSSGSWFLRKLTERPSKAA